MIVAPVDMTPLHHVVVVMLENRSFDHLLSGLPSVDGHPDVATDETNPNAKGGTEHRYHESCFCDASEPGTPSWKMRGFGSLSQWYSIRSSVTMYAGSTAEPEPGAPV